MKIISIDAKKATDKIKHTSMIKTLKQIKNRRKLSQYSKGNI